jgi:hypothetical protein
VARAGLGIAVVVCFMVGACGSGSDSKSSDRPAIAEDTVTADCGSAIGGSGSDNWRQLATASGRFGVYGTGRDFRTAQKSPVAQFSGLRQRRVAGPILVTKTPFVVEGKDSLVVAIAPSDRERAGLVTAPYGGGPYAEIRFVPCRDQSRTWYSGGWVLRDPDQVTVLIHEDNGPESRLVAGRP